MPTGDYNRRRILTTTTPLLPHHRPTTTTTTSDPHFTGSSFSGAVFNLSTTIVGAGIMALPATLKQLGMIPGLIVILLVGMLTELSVDIIIRFSRASKSSSYAALVGDAFGGPGKALLQIGIVVNNVGLLVVYMIIIGDVLSGTWSEGEHHLGLMQEWFGHQWWTSRSVLLLLTSLLVFSPLISFKRVDSLRFTSALSVGLAVVFVVITAGVTIVKMFNGSITTPRLHPNLADQTSFLKLFTTVPVLVTAYICHHNVHPIDNELKDPTQMKSIVKTSIILCSSVYIATGFFGFLLFGDHTQDDVLANFDGDLGIPYSSLINDVVRISYCLHLMLVFPIIFFSLRLNLDGLLFPYAIPIAFDNRRFFLVTALLMSFVFLGANFVPSIWDAFQFTGATATVSVGFIFPAAVALRMDNEIETKLLQNEETMEGDLKQRLWSESKKIWRVTLPSIISRVSSFGTIVVTQSFIGHVSDLDLAGYALVQTLSVRFINGILLGMSSATETLCGQSFGAGQDHMMGIHLQRSWIVDLITVTILLPILIFATQIFKLVGQEESIANSGGYISLWFIPYVYNYVFSMTIQMYLQAQLKNMIIAWLSAFQFALHILLSLLFVYTLNLGVPGAMLALVMSSWSLVIGEFIYIFGGWCPHSWKGFTVAAFKDLMPLVKLSISSGVMLCLELWYNAVLVLLAGYMANAEVAISAFSIWYRHTLCFYFSLCSLNINLWEFMISLGFLGAGCVRVANELGRGNAKAVNFSIKVVLGTSIVIGVFFFFLCLVFRKNLAYLFTNDERVADTISDLSLLVSFSVLLNSVYPVLSGVAIGAGMQSTVAIVNLVCFYLIGIPLGALLGYLTSLEVKGIWIGMIGGVLAQTITLIYIIWRTNWDDEVKKASERLMRFYVKTDENAT